jgi:hypothetical protein
MTSSASSSQPLAGLVNFSGSPLQQRIVETAQHLFEPAELSPTLSVGAQSSRTATRIGAFVVLAHAQLEEALETSCRSVLRRLESTAPSDVWQGWNSFLVHSNDPETLGNLMKRKNQVYPPTGRLLLKYLAQDYEARVIGGNNGISKKYLTSLFGPLGLDLSVHVVDVNTLTAFAELRGPLAHTGGGTIQQSSPLVVVNQGVGAAFAVDNISKSADMICSSASVPSISPMRHYLTWWRRALIWLAGV